MSHESYAFIISGTGMVREFKLEEVSGRYSLPHYVNAIIRSDDVTLDTYEGKVARDQMNIHYLDEIRFNWDTHTVHVTARSEVAWESLDLITAIVGLHVNSHFKAARRIFTP